MERGWTVVPDVPECEGMELLTIGYSALRQNIEAHVIYFLLSTNDQRYR
jgi:hypothetical protein